MRRSPFALLILFCIGVAGCGSDSPTAPTPPATATTRIVRLGGNLNFGNVIIGQAPPDGLVTVSNDGNAVLNVSGMTGPCAGGATTVVGSASFAVAPQQTVNVTIRFRPT